MGKWQLLRELQLVANRIADAAQPKDALAHRVYGQAKREFEALIDAGKFVYWRPISESPQDGTLILVIGGRHKQPTIVPADGGFWNMGGKHGCPEAVRPTHFMPLPEPPQEEG